MRANATPRFQMLCPISCELMRDPVIAADGHTYERAAITRWIESWYANARGLAQPRAARSRQCARLPAHGAGAAAYA